MKTESVVKFEKGQPVKFLRSGGVSVEGKIVNPLAYDNGDGKKRIRIQPSDQKDIVSPLAEHVQVIAKPSVVSK